MSWLNNNDKPTLFLILLCIILPWSHGLLSNLLQGCTWNLFFGNSIPAANDMASDILITHQYKQLWTLSTSSLYFPKPTIKCFEICTINILIFPITSGTLLNILEIRGYDINSVFILTYNQETTRTLAFDHTSLIPYNSPLYFYGISTKNRNLTNSAYISCPWCIKTQKFLAIEKGINIWSEYLNKTWKQLSYKLHKQNLLILDPINWVSNKRPCTKESYDKQYCFAKYYMINELAIHFNFTPILLSTTLKQTLPYIYPSSWLISSDINKLGEFNNIY